MILRLSKSKETQRVSPQDILDYNTFARRHQRPTEKSELRQFERFHAARHLISQEMDAYLDAKLTPDDSSQTMTVDVCGAKNGTLIAVFCQTAGLDEPLASSIETINKAQNASAVILLPRELDQPALKESMRAALEKGKVTMEVLGWFDDTFEEPFRESLGLIELLGNQTRMSEDDLFSNWPRRRWRFPTANLFDELEQDFEAMFKDLELPKDLVREL